MRKDRRKKESVKRGKRRGFSGKRRQEINREFTSDASPQDVNPQSSSGVSDVLTTNTTADQESVSTKKLLNTSFEKFESSQGILTREQARKVGLGSSRDVEIATGFKIQDATLLSDCISAAAICSSCRKATSKHKLYQKKSER